MMRRTLIAAVAAVAGSIAVAGVYGPENPGEPAPNAAAALTQAVEPSESVPEVTLKTVDGGEVTLGEMLEDGPVVLMFYRGSWCPYCNQSLKQFNKHADRFTSAGARLIAVSPELSAGLKKMKQSNGLTFDLFSDPGSEAARAFGVSYELGRSNQRLADANGVAPDEVELPLGVTYVIDSEGEVTWAFLEDDYSKRADPAEVLAAVEDL